MTKPSADTDRTKLLETFVAKKKFSAEKLYSGVRGEPERLRFEGAINDLAGRLSPLVTNPKPKKDLLNEFKAFLPLIETADTEDRERALTYLEELMDIFGVESSDGLLNQSLYGFNPVQSPESRNSDALAVMSLNEREMANEIKSQTAQTIAAYLVKKLGPPKVDAGPVKMWMNDGKPNLAIALNMQGGKTVLTWMVQGKFMFTHVM